MHIFYRKQKIKKSQTKTMNLVSKILESTMRLLSKWRNEFKVGVNLNKTTLLLNSASTKFSTTTLNKMPNILR